MKMFSLNFRNEIYKTLAFSYRNLLITRRNFFTIFETLFWPLIGLLSVGLMGAYLELSRNLLAFIMIGAVALSIMQLAQLDVTYVLLFDIWSKSIKYTLVAPVSFFNMVAGSWLVGVIRGFIAFLILSFSGELLFGLNLVQMTVTSLLLFLFGLFINAMLIGMSTCILLLIFGYRAEVAAWTLTAIIMLVCGIYYPVTVLPAEIRYRASFFYFLYKIR
ncbi:MAG TPA: ABC transporter permease [Archaeoglobaceae archaeon]|nr:ABC transporter permease [Archaeoglobaceae archaeon]